MTRKRSPGRAAAMVACKPSETRSPSRSMRCAGRAALGPGTGREDSGSGAAEIEQAKNPRQPSTAKWRIFVSPFSCPSQRFQNSHGNRIIQKRGSHAADGLVVAVELMIERIDLVHAGEVQGTKVKWRCRSRDAATAQHNEHQGPASSFQKLFREYDCSRGAHATSHLSSTGSGAPSGTERIMRARVQFL